jgi:hypothetical protein
MLQGGARGWAERRVGHHHRQSISGHRVGSPDFIRRYIFPVGCLTKAAMREQGVGLILESVKIFSSVLLPVPPGSGAGFLGRTVEIAKLKLDEIPPQWVYALRGRIHGRHNRRRDLPV